MLGAFLYVSLPTKNTNFTKKQPLDVTRFWAVVVAQLVEWLLSTQEVCSANPISNIIGHFFTNFNVKNLKINEK